MRRFAVVHRNGLALVALCLVIAAPSLARGEDGASPASQADDALQRCWAVKMGMSSEEVSRVLGAYVPGAGWTGAVGKFFPCSFRINNFGVYEIQITDHRVAPPHEALFAEALRREIATWGVPDWITFSEDKLKWTAAWGHGTSFDKTFWIEPEPTEEPLTGSKNGSFIHYMIVKRP